ncbi:MAG TPA: FAD:protein FMN transferase [Pirellulaceae bacterium]|jgi:thiamine biosynthesis lipoprotein|nr:FAD:protein FMN transferase [Pirellulaceae bacterium]
MTTIYARRPAMRTLFEIVLVGDDAARLRSLAGEALDEVERVERLLSRFDPSAEVYRVNRDGTRGWVRVDPELFAVLQDAARSRAATDGWFEPFPSSREESHRTDPLEDRACPLSFSSGHCSVRFASPETSIDLGAFGKGYALDRLRDLLLREGARDWLLSGGGSSVAASGCREDGGPWTVGVEDPFVLSTESPQHLAELPLSSGAVSTSMTLAPGAPAGSNSDIFNPRTGEPVAEAASCVVVHESAADAEVWSTALLAAGRRRAVELLDRARSAGEERTLSLPMEVYWIARRDGASEVEILSGEGHALADRSA